MSKKNPLNREHKMIEYCGIDDYAKEVFDKIADIYRDKIDVALDFATLAIYAQSVSNLKRYNEIMRGKSPFIEKQIHPLVNVISMQQKQINYCSAKLGLTPDARNKIKLDLEEINRVGKKKITSESGEDISEFC